MGFVENGHDRKGSTLYAYAPLTGVCTEVRITDPVFIDAQGDRARG